MVRPSDQHKLTVLQNKLFILENYGTSKDIEDHDRDQDQKKSESSADMTQKSMCNKGCVKFQGAEVSDSSILRRNDRNFEHSANENSPLDTNGKREFIIYDWDDTLFPTCLLYTSPSPRDQRGSRMPSSA